MSDTTTSGLGNEPAADLDSVLFNAVEAHFPKEDDAAGKTAEKSGDEAPVVDAERPRGPDGKFIAKDSAADAPDKGPADAATTAADPPQPDPALAQPIEPPARWTAEEKAKFAAWPRDVQEAVIERNKAIEADYTRKTQEAADLRRSAEPYLNAVKPYEGYLRQIAPSIGQTPDQMVSSLLGVEYQLRTGDPYQKVTALAQIAQSYGIDLAALSRGEMPAPPDPALSQLRQSYGHLEQRLSQYEAMIEQQQQQQLSQQIEAFRSATDSSGRPLYPHFDRVRGVMAQILREDSAIDLGEAYKKAIEPIQAAIADELRNRQTQADTQRKEALEKAKKAAPVKSTGSQPNGQAQSKDLDSLLWDSINAKIA